MTPALNVAGLSRPCPHLGERGGDADGDGSRVLLQPRQQQRVPDAARLDAGEGQHAHGHPCKAHPDLKDSPKGHPPGR